ncbi:MAG: hypothetical protein ACYCUI_04365 [Vulcanimicrobiaceae bacterium]
MPVMPNLIILGPSLPAFILITEWFARQFPADGVEPKSGESSRALMRRWFYSAVAIIAITSLYLRPKVEVVWLVVFLVLMPMLALTYVAARKRI